MSYKDLRPCLPGEGHYARPKSRVTHHGLVGLIPARRWVHFVHPVKDITERDDDVSLLPAYLRPEDSTSRH